MAEDAKLGHVLSYLVSISDFHNRLSEVDEPRLSCLFSFGSGLCLPLFGDSAHIYILTKVWGAKPSENVSHNLSFIRWNFLIYRVSEDKGGTRNEGCDFR